MIGGWPSKVEPTQVLCISKIQGASWARDTLDLTELARLRHIEGLKIEEITNVMGVSTSTVVRGLRMQRETRQNP